MGEPIFSRMDGRFVVSIDLGTTNSVVAIVRPKTGARPNVEVVRRNGHRITPSYVFFEAPDKLQVGQSAMKASRQTLYDAKRMIGRFYRDIKFPKTPYTFELEEYRSLPRYVIHFSDGRTATYRPEEVSSLVLKALLEAAQKKLGLPPDQPIVEAYITHPAYFTSEQVKATREAASLAGLRNVHLVPEPMAAAIAYGDTLDTHEEKKILIFDFGGGTLDVCIMRIVNGTYNVLAYNGNSNCGGRDIDDVLASYAADRFRAETGVDLLTQTEKVISELYRRCREAKEELTESDNSEIDMDFLGHSYPLPVDRQQLNTLCDLSFSPPAPSVHPTQRRDIFGDCLREVDSALAAASLRPGDIDEVVLVGGSSVIPRISVLLEQRFGKRPLQTIDPSEAVAYGAASLGAFRSGLIPSSKDGIAAFTNVNPMDIGLEEGNTDRMIPIVRAGIPLPMTAPALHTVSTSIDHQRIAELCLRQGSSPKASDNFLLGRFKIKLTKDVPKNTGNILVQLILNEDGILNVTACEKGTENYYNVIVSGTLGVLSAQNADRFILLERANVQALCAACAQEPFTARLASLSAAQKQLKDTESKPTSVPAHIYQLLSENIRKELKGAARERVLQQAERCRAEIVVPELPPPPTQNTFYLTLLDQSGSMRSKCATVVKMFNKLLSTIKDEVHDSAGAQTATLGLLSFESSLHYLRPLNDIDSIAPLRDDEFAPLGRTKLYEAITAGLDLMMNAIAGKRNVRVRVSIWTDGIENESAPQFTLESTRALIADRQRRGWDIRFWGSDAKAIEVAASLNITGDSARQFDDTPESWAMAFQDEITSITDFLN